MLRVIVIPKQWFVLLSEKKTMETCFFHHLNLQKIISSTIPCTNIKAKPDDREKAEIESQHSVVAALKAINTEISDALKGLNPKQQNEIDKILL